MYQFVKSLNIKQNVRKTDKIGKDLIKEIENLERPDLLADKNLEEAAQLK